MKSIEEDENLVAVMGFESQSNGCEINQNADQYTTHHLGIN